MRFLNKIQIRLKKPQLLMFSYFPIIVYDNSYITIKWHIKNCLFIRINNKIGFKKIKGEFFTLITSGTKYKIKAFGLFGIRTFELIPNVQIIEKKEIKGVRMDNTLKEIEERKGLSINIKTFLNSEMIRNKTLVIHKKEIQFDITNIANNINEIHNTKTINKINNLKKKSDV